MIHHTVAHHMLTDAQPVLQQWLMAPCRLSQVYTLGKSLCMEQNMFCMVWNITSVSLGQLSRSRSLLTSCAPALWQSMGH